MIGIASNVIGSGIVVICNGSDVIGIISDINSYNINMIGIASNSVGNGIVIRIGSDVIGNGNDVFGISSDITNVIGNASNVVSNGIESSLESNVRQ